MRSTKNVVASATDGLRIRRSTDAARHRRATAATLPRARAAPSASAACRCAATAGLRSSATSAAGNASLSRSARNAQYCAVHGPKPGSATSRATCFLEGADGIEQFADRPSPPAPTPSAPRCAPSACRAWSRDRRQQRAPATGTSLLRRASPVTSAPTLVPARATSLAGELARAADRDLLAEDGAHGEFETVPRARRAQAGPLRRPAAPDRHRRKDARRWTRHRHRDRTGGAAARRWRAAPCTFGKRIVATRWLRPGDTSTLPNGAVDLDGAQVAVVRRPARRLRSRARRGTRGSHPSRRARDSRA